MPVDPLCVGCDKVEPVEPVNPDVAKQREAAAAATAYQDSLAEEAAKEVVRRDAENAVRAQVAADAEKAATEKAQVDIKAAADALAGAAEAVDAGAAAARQDEEAFQTAASDSVADPNFQWEDPSQESQQEAPSLQEEVPGDSTYLAAAGLDGEGDQSVQ